jgi:hypothetical protein
MNMREFWANEAAAMRDTSGVLGKEVLKPVSNSFSPSNNDVDEKFATGYSLEGNKIVFSTFVYNATERRTNNEIRAFFEKAKLIQQNFTIGGYSFDFRYQFVNKPKYDYNGTYRNYYGSNSKLKAYVPKDRQSIDDIYLKWITDDSKLPDYYYMELFDETDFNSGSDGGTHPNNSNRIRSCYFGLTLSKMLDNQRTIIHESLHPVLDHTWSNSDINPLYSTFERFFLDIKEKVAKPESDTVINTYIKNKLAIDAEMLRQNIMTTTSINSESEISKDLAKYLYEYLYNFIQLGSLSKGTKINILQIKKIVQILKG